MSFNYQHWLKLFKGNCGSSILIPIPEELHGIIKAQDLLGSKFENAPFAIEMACARGPAMDISADLSVYIAIAMLCITPGEIMMYLMATKLSMINKHVDHATFDWFMEEFSMIPDEESLEGLWQWQKMDNGANACDHIQDDI